MRSLLICGLNNYIDNFFFLYKLNFPRSPFANPSTHRSSKTLRQVPQPSRSHSGLSPRLNPQSPARETLRRVEGAVEVAEA